jgi:hypothetical protein
MKFVVRMKVNLCQASFWGQVAMMMKIQNFFFNTLQVKKRVEWRALTRGRSIVFDALSLRLMIFQSQEIGNGGTRTLR